MNHLLCLVSPVACVGKTIAKATLGNLFDAMTNWILSSVQWFLTAAGQVLTSASEPATVVRAASTEFDVLLRLAPVLLTLGLLVATLQAVRHGDGASLWRVYLGVAPSCVVGIALARPLATLVLEAVNQLSTSAATTVVAHEATLAKSMADVAPSTPGFGLFLLAIGVVIGTWLLWCELIVRTVVLTLLLVLVPVVVPLSTFPSGRRLGWRLGETFVAVAASKLLIVITLSLGLNELMGSSATQVITGAVTLMLATFSPFLLLRVIPFMEQSALHNLEGIRSRFTRAAVNVPSSPLGAAVRSLTPEMPMTGPPSRPDDLGFAMWPGDGEVSMPSTDGEPLPPPIGTPRARGGHVAYHQDEMGPVVGWHFDE
jgi:hypothetical protein